MYNSEKHNPYEEENSSSHTLKKSYRADSPAVLTSTESQHGKLSPADSENNQPEALSNNLECQFEKEQNTSSNYSNIHNSTAENDNSKDVKQKLSPKNKRSIDQIEGPKDREYQEIGTSETKTESLASCGRISRSEPEKKRPRDTSESESLPTDQETVSRLSITDDIKTLDEKHAKSIVEPRLTSNSVALDQPKKSTLTFGNSSFMPLANSKVSPFGSLGATKTSVFGGNLSSSPREDLSVSSSNRLTFKTSDKCDISSSKEAPLAFCFGGKTTSGFVSAFSNSTVPKLSSFATPGVENELLKNKPTRAFGAPEISDNNSESEADGSGEDDVNDHGDKVTKRHDEKLKNKLKIDDGEAGEVTLLQVRAKLFAIKSKDHGWKERGIGTLKINVPENCVRYSENGTPIPGSYCKPRCEDNEENNINIPRAARLIMRQENTHRVVLNTIILPEIEFEEKPAISSAQLLFTALEADKEFYGDTELRPIRLLLKMSEANAKIFKAEIKSIKSQL